MKPLFASAVFCLCITVVAAEKPAVVPKIKLGKDTTYLLEPLDADGYINYERALNGRAKGKTTPETNAVVLHWQVIGVGDHTEKMMPGDYFKELGIARPTNDPEEVRKQFVDATRYFTNNRGQVDRPYPYLTQEENSTYSLIQRLPWTARQYPEFVNWLLVNREPLSILTASTRRNDYYSPLVYRSKEGTRAVVLGSLLPTAWEIRRISEALAIRALHHAGEGKPDDAWADILTLHRLARQVARGQTITDSESAMQIELLAYRAETAFLATGYFTADTLRDYQKSYAELQALPSFVPKFGSTERLTMLDSLQFIRRDGLKAFDRFGLERELKFDNTLNIDRDKLNWEPSFQLINAAMDRATAALQQPTYQQRLIALAPLEQDFQAVVAKLKSENSLDLMRAGNDNPNFPDTMAKFLFTHFMRDLRKVLTLETRVLQLRVNRETAFGLALYRAENFAYPETLQALVPKYLAEIPIDRFSEKPMIYRRTEQGYLLYSVGPNGQDDGGRTPLSNTHDDLTTQVPLAIKL